MNSCSGQKASILVSFLKTSLFRSHIWVHHLISHAIWTLACHELILFTSDKPILEIFHNSKKLLEAHLTAAVKVELFKQIDCFLRVSSQTFHDCLQVIDIDDTCLILVKHIEDASKVFDFLFRILLEDVKLISIDVLLELIDSGLVNSSFVESIDIGSFLWHFWRPRVGNDIVYHLIISILILLKVFFILVLLLLLILVLILVLLLFFLRVWWELFTTSLLDSIISALFFFWELFSEIRV